MSATLTLMMRFASPVQEVQPWSKAFSYSVGGHATLLLMMIFLTHTKLPTTVLTEVKFIQNTPVEPVAPASMQAQGIAEGEKSGSADGIADARPLKSKMDLNTQGQGPLLGTNPKGDIPGGSGHGTMGAAQPLSGPIVATEPIGWVGRKQGALIEMSHRTGGNPGAGSGPKGQEGKMYEPIALGKMGVDDIRKKEIVIGTPLISQKVVSSAVGASGYGGSAAGRLAGTQLGEKRNTAIESLKSNPLDADKWGKSDSLFSLEGPLKYRKILKMELPPYPRWAEEKAIEAGVSIRLWVDAKGIVKDNMYLERTSGYSELDQLAMDALKRFVFVKVPDNQAQDDEWGVATFRFKLRK